MSRLEALERDLATALVMRTTAEMIGSSYLIESHSRRIKSLERAIVIARTHELAEQARARRAADRQGVVES